MGANMRSKQNYLTFLALFFTMLFVSFGCHNGAESGADETIVNKPCRTTVCGKPLSLAGIVSTIAGKPDKEKFFSPSGITTDGKNLYVVDTVYSIVSKISLSTGAVSVLAGTPMSPGSEDGIRASAKFSLPGGIATDGTNLYVADTANNTIRKIVISTGVVTTFAGKAYNIGSADGVGAAASFMGPKGITTDGKNLYVTDSYGSTIRKIVISTGKVTTLAGAAGKAGYADGIGASARFNEPIGITTDGKNLYVTEYGLSSVRKIVISTGVVSTLAGPPRAVGTIGFADNAGAAAHYHRFGITTDRTNLYEADTVNNTIRKIVISTGAVSILAGTPSAGAQAYADGTGATARFFTPVGITTDGKYLYVTDTGNGVIRKIR
jgi:sugar lactone lactonase YvrE